MARDDDEDQGRVIGNTTHDALLARMIERSDAMMRQAEASARAIEALNNTIGAMQVTLGKLDVTVKNIGDAMVNYHDLDARMRAAEGFIQATHPEIKDNTKFRQTLIRYGILLALAGIAGSGTMSSVVTKIMGWH